MEAGGTNLTWEPLWDVPPQASEAAIARVEAVLGLRFPEAFRDLLRAHQGQMPTSGVVPYTGPDGEATWVDISGLFHVEPDACPGESILGAWRSLQDYFEGDAARFPPGFPAKLVPFTDDPGGSPVCLDYRGEGPPAVVRVQYHDCFHEGTLTPVAPSFEAFLAALGRTGGA